MLFYLKATVTIKWLIPEKPGTIPIVLNTRFVLALLLVSVTRTTGYSLPENNWGKYPSDPYYVKDADENRLWDNQYVYDCL
jgi:hypothetical protein